MQQRTYHPKAPDGQVFGLFFGLLCHVHLPGFVKVPGREAKSTLDRLHGAKFCGFRIGQSFLG
jgi:hypothetical protein